MQVFTPREVARHATSKYMGVLVAAKYARELNALPREAVPLADATKLTTQSLESLISGRLEYRLVKRRRKNL
ncbi:MAG: DNA-directed RNA polymerase subunit omega [Longimicrobiales bacterium]